MGGTLGLTLRRKDGEEFRTSCWTNWSPWAIDHIDLANQKPKHITKILKGWRDQLHLPEKQRHWAYRNPYLAPSEYGLVVVDYKTNKLLDCNHYHTFGHFSGVILRGEYFATRITEHMVQTGGSEEKLRLKAFIGENARKVENQAAMFYRFYLEGRIKDVQKYNSKEEKWRSINEDVNKWPIEKIIDELIAVENFDQVAEFDVDMSPFEVIRFKDTADGWREYRQEVINLGFKLTEVEEELWQERIARRITSLSNTSS